MDFGIGLFIGMLVMFILWHYDSYLYKKILVMNAEHGTAEYINGKFYYIKEEGKK